MTSTQAAGIRAARAARVRAIRHRVIAGAVALFVATWLLITLMLVTGHDPALARQTKTKSAILPAHAVAGATMVPAPLTVSVWYCGTQMTCACPAAE